MSLKLASSKIFTKTYHGGSFLLVIFLLLISVTQKATATHAAGADLTYTCLGGLLYQVEATFYRDCGGSSEPGNVTITYKSANCAFTRSVIANKVLTNNGQEITLPCANAPSTCNGGMSAGIRKWVYRTTVTLPQACADWVFSYRICCRNCSITTIQSPCASNSEIYVEAKLNNVNAPGNSSPGFNNMPVAFVCLGQNFNYNQGVYDVDGDSLSYELIAPKTSALADITWLAPATTQTPLASSTPFTINPVTGDINFTPSAMQIGILAIRVNEYRNGLLIGSTIRDMQVYTQNCFNSIPVATGINGTSSYVTNACAGEQICFTVSAQDIDSTQNVTFNVYNPIPGSVVTQTPGNRPTFQFCWTPDTSDISRQPYMITLTIRDDACPVNGVQAFSYSIFVNGPQATTSITNPGCEAANGSANVTVINETNCTYSWNTVPPQLTQNATGLSSGNYIVTVTDLLGCEGNFNVQLQSPANTVNLNCTSSGVISCQTGNIGIAQATVSGGASPYSYLWSTGATTASINSLGQGTYTVTVTDGSGCSASDTTVILSAPGNLYAQATLISGVSCYGYTNGAVSVSPSGGSSPYTYSWNNGVNTQSNTNLAAGNYTIIITDVSGCTAASTITVSQPAGNVSGIISNTSVSCFGLNDGLLSITAQGGTVPYTYSWSNGSVSNNVSALYAGNYSVTITDANGCSQNYPATVIQPASALNILIQSTQQVSCFGGNNGSIALAVSGGVAPYNFAWDNGSLTSVIQNLETGSYYAVVTDNNGCTAAYAATISEPASPVLGIATVISNVFCYGGTNGGINLTVNGGTAPYTYIWSNGFAGRDPANIPAGNYMVTISDANGCVANVSSTISQPQTSLASGILSQQILCFNGNNGSITLTASGGTSPYTYLWNTGATISQVTALGSGTYTVTVTDANNCVVISSAVITQPSAPLIPVAIVQNPGCNGSSGGSISLTVSGGTSPYAYSWNNGATTQNTSGLVAGNYTVTITDANGCNAIISEAISISGNPLVVSATVSQSVSCFGGINGAATVSPQGGMAPFSYLWNNGASTPNISGIAAGTYTVTVTGSNGCTAITTVDVSQPLSGISLTGNVTGANCLSGGAGNIALAVSGGSGSYSYLWSNGASNQNAANLAVGNYSVVVTDNNGCSVTANYTILSDQQFEVVASGLPIICAGETITLTADSVSGGSYQWYYDGDLLNGATGNQFITPAAGIYSVTVTNSCGTFSSNEIEIEVKSIGNVSVSNMQIICPPETAQLQATGGNTYEWTPAEYITFTTIPDPFVSPLTTTNYAVQITNQWGCKTTLTTEIAVLCDSLMVPTGFSPNSDGVNDGYVIDGIENYPGNKLWVYNRWGKLVFKAKDYTNSWDAVGNVSGMNMGQKVPSGTYYFILDLNDGSRPRAGFLIIRGS